MFPLFFLGATFPGHHPRLLEQTVGATVHVQPLPRDDRAVHGLQRCMIRTDHYRSHARVRDLDHDHHVTEQALARKAPVSTDDEALVTAVTVTGVGALTGAEAVTVIKKLGRSTCGVEKTNKLSCYFLTEFQVLISKRPHCMTH